MSSQAGRPSEHIPRVGRRDAKPGRDVRPALAPSDGVLSSPLNVQHGPVAGDDVLTAHRPQISGAADAVVGAPLTPPPDRDGLMLSVDSAGGYAVPKQLDGKKKKRR